MLFCPYCGTSLNAASTSARTKKRTGFPIAAGILIVIASCVATFVGILGFIAFAFSVGQYTYYYFEYYQYVLDVFIGMFSAIGCAFGLTAGILSIKRRHFVLSIVGTSLVTLSGFVILLAFAIMPHSSVIWGLLYGIPTIFLSILGIIFVSISKGEFT